jgi:hypothetical protein
MANMGYDDQHPPAQTPGAISERGVATPWNEDYEFPASVGPVSILYIVCVFSSALKILLVASGEYGIVLPQICALFILWSSWLWQHVVL